MEDEVEIRIKCFHALQCVLQYGADTTEAVKVKIRLLVTVTHLYSVHQRQFGPLISMPIFSLCVWLCECMYCILQALQQQYVPLMLSLVALSQCVEEQESCLRLLVSLSSCRDSHPSVAHGLIRLRNLMFKRLLYPEILVRTRKPSTHATDPS